MVADIRAVIFDIGNVLVHWNPRRLYGPHFEDPRELEHFLNNVVSPAWNLEQDRGRRFSDAVALLSDEFPEYAALIQLFDSRWVETLGEEISGTVDILKQLIAAEVPVYALTNFSAEKWPIFCERHPFTQGFKGIVVSGEEKLIKPDRLIYQLALKRFGLKATEAIFVDDRLENVEAAQLLGMTGHHFIDAPSLAADLRARGLLV